MITPTSQTSGLDALAAEIIETVDMPDGYANGLAQGARGPVLLAVVLMARKIKLIEERFEAQRRSDETIDDYLVRLREKTKRAEAAQDE